MYVYIGNYFLTTPSFILEMKKGGPVLDNEFSNTKFSNKQIFRQQIFRQQIFRKTYFPTIKIIINQLLSQT